MTRETISLHTGASTVRVTWENDWEDESKLEDTSDALLYQARVASNSHLTSHPNGQDDRNATQGAKGALETQPIVKPPKKNGST